MKNHSQFYSFVSGLQTTRFIMTVLFMMVIPVGIISAPWVFSWNTPLGTSVTVLFGVAFIFVAGMCIYCENDDNQSTIEIYEYFTKCAASSGKVVSQPVSDQVSKMLENLDVLKIVRTKVGNKQTSSGTVRDAYRLSRGRGGDACALESTSFGNDTSSDVLVVIHCSGAIVVAVSDDIMKKLPMEKTAELVANKICESHGVTTDTKEIGYASQYV